MSISQELNDLRNHAQLEIAVRETYERALARETHDPARVAAARSVWEMPVSAVEALRGVAHSARYALDADWAGLTLIGDHDAKIVAGDGFIPDDTTTPADATYCRHMVTGETFMVPNALEDLLVCDLQATKDHDVMAYLGVPIVVAAKVVGALCVVAKRTREWTAVDAQVLTTLAIGAAYQLEARAA